MSEKLTVFFISKIKKDHAIIQISSVKPKMNGCYGGCLSLNIIFGILVAVLIKLWYDGKEGQ